MNRIIIKIKTTWYNFRSRCQRFKRGWAYGDVWDIDQWFMRTVKPMLFYLRVNGVSFPIEFKDRTEWTAVLNEMIARLEFMDEDNVYALLGFGEIEDYKRMTKEDYKNVYRIMEENKNRFFELFSKYFFDLWD